MSLPVPNIIDKPVDELIPKNAQIGRYTDVRNIPENAIILTKDQVLQRLWSAISNAPRRESWPFLQGLGVIGGLAAATGFLATAGFRHSLRLGSQSNFSSYLPTVVLPTMVTAGFHNIRVSNAVLLQETDCQLCYETRAMSIQASAGFVMPVSLGLLGSLALARSKHTIDLPPLKDGKKTLEFLRKITRRNSLLLCGLLAANLFGAAFITQKEINLVPTMHRKAGLLPDHAND